MPWNDESGGSGKGPGPWGAGGGSGSGSGSGGSNNNSPWGRPGGTGGGGNGNGGGGDGGGRRPADLEEQMRRMQERFRLRGSGSGRGGSGGRRPTGLGGLGPAGLFLIGAVALVAWFSTGVVVVDAREQAVVFRFGKWVTNFGPGFHVHWPAPIETHVVLPVEEQKQTRVGDGTGEALMLTGDENIAQIRFTVFWKINSLEPQNFLLNVDNPEALVQAVGESVMREVVGRRQLQPIITTERQALQTEVRNAVVALLEQYRAGVDVLDVQIQESDAPAQVIDAFRDVAAAEQDAATTINEAERYRSQKVPEARGEATKILNDAEAYREAEIAKARGDVARFLSVLEEYRKAPRVTRERLFLETMEKVLGRSEKIILDSDSNALPFLPLDRLMGAGNTTRTER